jgi:hypothetical protein
MNWGACYLDHYAKYFGAPVAREVFSQDPDESTIQILAHDGVFKGCRVFSSLGLSHYADDVGSIAEVIVPVDDGWDAVPRLVANALFHMVKEQMAIGWGVAIGGLRRVDPNFSRRYGKEALYLANVYGLPVGAEKVSCEDRKGSLYLGIFLAESEYRLFLEGGAEALEAALERNKVDPYHLSRSTTAPN